MKNILSSKAIFVLLAFVVSFGIASCVLTDNVDSGRLIQKRKYNKGFFVRKSTHVNPEASVNTHQDQESATQSSMIPDSTGTVANSNEVCVEENQFDCTIEKPIGETVVTESKEDGVPATTFTTSDIVSLDERVTANGKQTKSTSAYEVLMILGCCVLGGIALVIARSFFGTTLRVSTWASKNRKFARGLIICSQFGLLMSGIGLGREFALNNCAFTNATEITATSLFLLGFAFLLLKHKSQIPIRSIVFQKIAHAGVAVALLLGSVGIGNRLSLDKEQVTTYGVVASHFADNTTEASEPVAAPQGRGGLVFLYVILALLLILVVGVLSCAAICELGAAGAVFAFLGLALIIAVIVAMVRSVRRRYPRPGDKVVGDRAARKEEKSKRREQNRQARQAAHPKPTK